MGRWSVILAFSGFLALGAAAAPAAEEAPPSPEVKSLRGIRAFGVSVSPLDPEAEKEGVTSEFLREEMRSFLNRQGMVVLKAGESYTYPGSPNLFLRVRARPTADGKGAAYALSLQFLQDVTLRRNRQEAYAATWDAADVVTAEGKDAVGETVNRLMERFMEAYAAAQSDRRGR